MKCMVQSCDDDAAWWYCWPGNPILYVCEHHAQQAMGLASHMGFHLEAYPIRRCVQLIGGEEPDPTDPAIGSKPENSERSEPDEVTEAERQALLED